MNRIIDISLEQSKILAQDKEFIYLEPMKIQPTEIETDILEGEICYRHKDSWIPYPYEAGDKIGIRQEWSSLIAKTNKKYKSINCITSNYPESYSNKYDYSPETMPKELHQTGVVKEILEPRKIRDILHSETIKIIGEYIDTFFYNIRSSKLRTAKELLGQRDHFSAWFNKTWAEPKPVLKCNYLHSKNMPVCLKCKIDYYICYMYDNENWMKLLLDIGHKQDIAFSLCADFKNCRWKDKELKVIVNAWSLLVRIGV